MSKAYTPMSQRDGRWARAWMNNNKDTPTSSYGCLITCLGMMADVPPDSVNYYMMAIKNYTPGTSKLARWDFSWTCGKVNYRGQSGTYAFAPFPDTDAQYLINWLAHDVAVLEVDFYPHDSTDKNFPPQVGEQQHFVLAVGVESGNSDTRIIIIDPWDGQQKNLCPRYGKTITSALVRAIYFQVK